jgi:hypothetical protein
MPIIKNNREKMIVLSAAVVADSDLSPAALGIYCFLMLSAETEECALLDRFPMDAKAVDEGIEELIAAGLMSRERSMK